MEKKYYCRNICWTLDILVAWIVGFVTSVVSISLTYQKAKMSLVVMFAFSPATCGSGDSWRASVSPNLRSKDGMKKGGTGIVPDAVS